MEKLVLVMLMGLILINGIGYGQNLISNPSFETGTIGQIPNGWGSYMDEGYLTLDNSTFHSGMNSLKGDHSPQTGKNKWRSLYYLDNNTKSIPYASYELSAWVKGLNGNEWVNIGFWRGAGVEIEYIGNAGLAVLTSKVWTNYKTEITLLTADAIGISIVGAESRPISDVYWIDDISFSLIRTKDQNKVYYTNILNDINASPELKAEANHFFADLYQYMEKDYIKAIPYLEPMNTIDSNERIGDMKLELLDLAGTKTAYSKAQAMAITQGLADKVKTLGNKIEGVNLAIKQNQPEPAPTTP